MKEKEHAKEAREPMDGEENAQSANGAAAAEESVDDLTTRLEAMQAERDDFFQRLARVSADYQNYQRRAEQNLADSVQFARGDLLRSLIPVLDHFDSALAAEPSSEDANALFVGVKIVRDELMKVLEQAGVERVDAKVGDPFDHEVHEAMLRQPADGVPGGHISLVMQPGYVYRKRTLRPAKVAVAPE